YWSQGVGSKSLLLWINNLFSLYDYLPHIGFTTWSGNKGMQKVGEKIGMTKEGVIRQVRYFEGQYYDAVKYGILRNELN
ncbi:GNAT family N-acetyltransferase, partial [Acinetobacter baumannii]|nr:GNAT family N-acetyltransferase [Acinetobacter baumannii]